MRTKQLARGALLAALCISLAVGLPGPVSLTSAEGEAQAAQADSANGALDERSSRDRSRGVDYAQYLAQHEGEGAISPQSDIVVDASQYAAVQGTGFETRGGFEGMEGEVLLTGEQGRVEWEIQVPESGLYHMSVLYYPIEGKSSGIERALLIDGELPFEEAAYLQFDRIWDNELEEVEQDNRGNDLRPRQVERPEWREALLKDVEGYYAEPFQFHFEAGKHTISFVSEREPMVIKQLKLFRQEPAPTYEEALQAYNQAGARETQNILLTVQGEQAAAKSSPTLYPQTERSSPAVEPYSASKTRVNTIGGYNWRVPGQWIEWKIDVPETGLYKIAFKSQQNFVRGIYSTRRLTIDGKLPFKEMELVPFRYKSGYRMDVLGGDDPYLYYLEKGERTIRLETTLGEFAPLIREVEDSLFNLNAMYRKILMITGAAPDQFRDYRVEQQIPDMLETFRTESDRLKRISKELRRLSGGSGDAEALLKTMSVQLDEMIDEPYTIPRRLGSYKSNTGGLGTWLLRTREMPLEIDELYVASPDKKLPKTGAGFFSQLKHEATTFVNSFVIDYNQIGNVAEDKDVRTVTVWIGSGRDQANTLKAMIDETFTPETGINVNLKLVQMHTLLPATLAGQGPDVAMQIGNDIPVNYAMRGAAADLSGFPDFEEVMERFRPSAVVPYRYEDGVYALPETQTFNMLFYRKDVLAELGLSVPETWDDVAELFAVLNKHHMEFGLPLVMQPQYPGENIAPNSLFAALLMQNGGEFYRDGGKESDLDSRVGIETFKTWTEFYTDYKLEREFDFPNRFRTGQMPIGIADYTTYNQLTVFAPEIRGLWGFVPIPGTAQADGSVRRDVPSGGSATIMLDDAEDKDAAWSFMKWWTSDEIQTTFGREMESLMGAAARYPTANINALDSLPWPVNDYEQLKAQFESVRGIPEVPGGYFTGRHLLNAFYSVVVNSADQKAMGITIKGEKAEPRETIVEYVQYMQEEIRNKRMEFGLDP
ncbi:extracellular solute-binding protein [Paenibacillus sp. LHD-117]|uniref:extracellular solute-binding protein n=1 Tax=Paenibacillus sp. LHD-117 TaxID=3071412 RepID=UPI0027DFFDB5|nr:extracellular solute-binding protein [Paenibacillus sp. LHD-117]MDQ6422884.1 extracellular solute-binding protein [Paenibacillus sp. LHD-117]